MARKEDEFADKAQQEKGKTKEMGGAPRRDPAETKGKPERKPGEAPGKAGQGQKSREDWARD